MLFVNGLRVRASIIAMVVVYWQLTSFAQSLYAQQTAGLLANMTSVTDEMLQSPPDSDWLNWRRTYDAFGHSPLKQINQQNVSNLKLAWQQPLAAGANMATPLIHDGVMFVYGSQDTLVAMDATSGELLWSYKHESDSIASAKIGVALYGDKVLVPTSDLRLVALNAKSGEVLWNHKITTTVTNVGLVGYSLRSSPLIANGMVIQGVTATFVPEGGFIVALDLETGEESWRFHTVARPGELGGSSWNGLTLEQRSGGSVWIPGSYDARLDLVYFGAAPTYDTAPLLTSIDQPGINSDALFTNATIALRPGSGELVWYYQHVANDQWDMDWVYERQIMDLMVDGSMRRVVITAGKLGIFDAMDAATGEYLFSIDMGFQNIIASIDPETGAKTTNPQAIPNADATYLLCPFALGVRNWPATSYNPDNKMLYVPVSEVCMDGGPTGKGGVLTTGAQMIPKPAADSDGKFGRIQAINVETRELVWQFREVVPPTTSTLSTSGGLVFVGALDGSFKALNDSTGEVLWQTSMGDIPQSFPVSYSVNGKQYIAVVIGQPAILASTWMGVISAFQAGSSADSEEQFSFTMEGNASIQVFALP